MSRKSAELSIGDLRAKREITGKQLSYGICSTSQLHMMEQGQRDGDPILVNTLWQRLGICTAGFRIISNRQERDLWEMRQRISDMVCTEYRQADKRSRMKEIMEQYAEKTVRKCKIHRQFLEYHRIMVSEQEGTSEAVLYQAYRTALAITMPELMDRNRPFTAQNSMNQIHWEKRYLGELELLLLIQTYRQLEKMGQDTEALIGYYKILQYAEKNNYEDAEKKQFCPQVHCYLTELLRKMGDDPEAKKLAKKATAHIRATRDEAIQRQEFLQMTSDREAGRYQRYTDCEVYAFKDVFQTRREHLGMTQEKIAEQIGCSVITIKRIEKGEQSPKRENAIQLLKAVGLSGKCFCRGNILE